MRELILSTLIRLRHDDEGVTLVEYGIALALAVTIGVAALSLLGGEITGAMTAAGPRCPTNPANPSDLWRGVSGVAPDSP